VVGADGARLELYPMLHVSWEAGAPALSGPGGDHPASRILEHPALAAWMERYDRDRRGWLSYDGPADPSALPSEAAQALRAGLSETRPGLILVEGHPGCGAGGAVAALSEDDPLELGLDAFDAVRRVAVRVGDLGQSGATVARVVLRAVEEALGEEPGSRADELGGLMGGDGALSRAMRELKAAGKRALLGLHALHHGSDDYRGEGLTVRQVYEALAESEVCVVATAVPGGLDRPLFDHRIVVPVVERPVADEVGRWVRRLAPAGSLHARVLRALGGADSALHLFAVCDAVEAGGGEPVFEPAVERTLWDLRPLLSWWRDEVEMEDGPPERVRLWRTFHAGVTEHLVDGGGA
jgi:hypothetical protein